MSSAESVRANTYSGSATSVMPSPVSATNWAAIMRRNRGRRSGFRMESLSMAGDATGGPIRPDREYYTGWVTRMRLCNILA